MNVGARQTTKAVEIPGSLKLDFLATRCCYCRDFLVRVTPRTEFEGVGECANEKCEKTLALNATGSAHAKMR
jgi:hypothetical protein